MNLYIVEDSVLIQNRLIRFVEEVEGMHVLGVASDISSAYSALLHNDADALILDIQLADGNGLQLLRDIKQSRPDIKVVVLTNHASDANRLHALRAGADGFLDKSTDFALLQDYLLRWQQPNSKHQIN
ncbi:response regulator transcription factor [Undibacterium sp. TS12]|uniref:response regulator n=1 Tax=Undibacterium sp. TS12 TaxID=2908202 RepID=UPI001F4C9C96|nr:response regulator transcription factor [Undibacterium sp. TS12]MCH8618942.1 response regulator transcription factor [Undibacterium sp. TS12]